MKCAHTAGIVGAAYHHYSPPSETAATFRQQVPSSAHLSSRFDVAASPAYDEEGLPLLTCRDFPCHFRDAVLCILRWD